MSNRALLFVAAALTACAPPVHNPRSQVDPQLASEIEAIRAVDDHAHPMRVVSPGEKDSEFDALPVEMMEPYDTAPLRMRPNSPEYETASRALFERDKKAAMASQGATYAVWVLDKLGIDIMLANRVSMGQGLPPARFKWVPFGDALMYPLNNESMGKHDPDRKAFFAAEEKLLHRYLTESGNPAMPDALDDYLRFVSATLDGWKKNGAVAVKLEMAYLRTLDVGNPDKAAVERVYSLYAHSGLPTDAEYKSLQDFLFRHIAAECGRLGMAVHFHSSAGAGRYFDVAGVNPMLIAPVVLDPAMRKTNFVFVHGAWPYTHELTALLDKPNVYADFSAQSSMLYPRALAEVLREWLEYVPEKVLFGTDASPVNEAVSWEETAYVANATGRDALGIALTAMLREREITRERASELARMVMRDNARRLYGFR